MKHILDTTKSPVCFRKRSYILKEGEISKSIYVIKKGIVRMSKLDRGNDITIQFFSEGEQVASFESFLDQVPSEFSIQAIEECEIYTISHEDFSQKILDVDYAKYIIPTLINRLKNYQRLFISHLLKTPEERYAELVKHQPQLILRVPQHYLASYLGITPVSLSRIRNRRE